jgi:cytochrome c-type biogenesis protein CcmH/NrfG
VPAASLDAMKQAADQQAAPLLEKLKSRPLDPALLTEIGTIYHSHHQFRQAAAYFDQAVRTNPKDISMRTKLASSLYRSGDTDGAMEQLNRGLADNPSDANSLFNLGMIRLQGKGDGKGAVDAWRKLLKSNPRLSPERKAEVQKMMADVLTTMSDQQSSRGAAK